MWIGEKFAIIVILGYCAYLAIRENWYHRTVMAILTRQDRDTPTLETINSCLTALNEECPKYTFCADCRANIAFRGRFVSLIYGNVGWMGSDDSLSNGGRFWNSKKLLYAISDLEQFD